jgi:hypothetical protein
MGKKTCSELLFEDFCKSYGIKFQLVETKSVEGKKTPDYDIFIEDNKIIIEVKQMNVNPEEKIKQDALNNSGIVTIKSELGKRVRGKIKDAQDKFKKRSENKYPSILILYDNVKYYKHTEPLEILSAMYGQLYFPVSYSNSEPLAQIGNIKLGGKRKMTEETNTSISAIGVIKKNSDGKSNMTIYHNTYANVPLSPKLLCKIPVKQYEINNNNSTEWQEI